MSRITYLDGRPDEVVEDPHFIVELDGDDWGDDPWNMTIDLTEMCQAAGKKVKDRDQNRGCEYWHIDLPIPQFRKVLKLVRKYAAPDLQEQVQQYLDQHFPRWAKEFRKLR